MRREREERGGEKRFSLSLFLLPFLGINSPWEDGERKGGREEGERERGEKEGIELSEQLNGGS